MAGVHYYTDYYDSLRMGERVAVGMLQEQIKTYSEKASMTFTSFDGDHILITSDTQVENGLAINGDDSEEAQNNWWLKHVKDLPATV